MQNVFSLEGPQRVTFGLGASSQLGQEVKLFGGERALVVIDPEVLKAGVAEDAVNSLAEAGSVWWFGENPGQIKAGRARRFPGGRLVVESNEVLKKVAPPFLAASRKNSGFLRLAQIAWLCEPEQFGGPSLARFAGCFLTARKFKRARRGRSRKAKGQLSNLLFIAVAGGAGALARWGLSGLVHRVLPASFPYGTFVVNVTGCFLFGLAWALFENRFVLAGTARIMVLTGFMGAFTTFSTFAFETSMLLRDGQWVLAFLNLAGQNLLGLSAMFGGLALAKAF